MDVKHNLILYLKSGLIINKGRNNTLKRDETKLDRNDRGPKQPFAIPKLGLELVASTILVGDTVHL